MGYTTLTTALSSLAAGVPVSPEIGMTGDVSLQGDVLPIGGRPEKLLAAQRAGMKKVFIPRDNLQDLRDVNPEIRDRLEIIPVDTVEEGLGALVIISRLALSLAV